MAEHWYYRVEAKGIQSFLFQTNQLKEILGGSALVLHLVDGEGLLGAVLAAVGAEAQLESAAAGGATLRFADKAGLARFVSRFPMEVARVAPGLELVQAWVRWDEQADGLSGALALRLDQARSLRPSRLPQVTPVIDPSPRGGGPMLAAAGLVQGRRADRLDAGLDRKLWMGERAVTELERRMLQRVSADGTPQQPSRPPEGVSWPTDIDEISGPDRAYVAVVHVDGNAIGQHVRGLSSLELRAFSRALSSVTRDAAAWAVEKVLYPGAADRVPGRIVVLGGDDLTAIVRADLALDFADHFMQRFAEQSRSDQTLKQVTGGAGLTASAGVAWVRAHHPFNDAYQLADALCSWAKAHGRMWDGTPPGLVGFQRVSDSLARDPRDQVDLGRRLVLDDVKLPARFGFGPYLGGCSREHAAARDAGFVSLRAIRDVGKALRASDLPRGAFRELVRLLESEPERAQARWERIQQVQERGRVPGWDALGESLADLDAGLRGQLWALGQRVVDGIPGDVALTPWLDAVVLSRHDAAGVGGAR